MTMPMRDLAEKSGLPRTTIHHYAREGLLPDARKTAPNAARYGQEHLDRLALITSLRAEGPDSRALSIPEVRLVLGHIDVGMDLHAAVRLVAEGIEARPADTGRWTERNEFAEASDVSPELVEALVKADLIDDGARGGFTPGDLLVARACGVVCANRGIDPADLTPLADLIREVGNYSATLLEVHAARTAAGPPAGTDTEALGAPLRLELTRLCDVLLWRALQA